MEEHKKHPLTKATYAGFACKHAGFDSDPQLEQQRAASQKKGVAPRKDCGEPDARLALTKLFLCDGVEHLKAAQPEREPPAASTPSSSSAQNTRQSRQKVQTKKSA